MPINWLFRSAKSHLVYLATKMCGNTVLQVPFGGITFGQVYF
jgi:hypothetical protein